MISPSLVPSLCPASSRSRSQTYRPQLQLGRHCSCLAESWRLAHTNSFGQGLRPWGRQDPTPRSYPQASLYVRGGSRHHALTPLAGNFSLKSGPHSQLAPDNVRSRRARVMKDTALFAADARPGSHPPLSDAWIAPRSATEQPTRMPSQRYKAHRFAPLVLPPTPRYLTSALAWSTTLAATPSLTRLPRMASDSKIAFPFCSTGDAQICAPNVNGSAMRPPRQVIEVSKPGFARPLLLSLTMTRLTSGEHIRLRRPTIGSAHAAPSNTPIKGSDRNVGAFPCSLQHSHKVLQRGAGRFPLAIGEGCCYLCMRVCECASATPCAFPPNLARLGVGKGRGVGGISFDE